MTNPKYRLNTKDLLSTISFLKNQIPTSTTTK